MKFLGGVTAPAALFAMGSFGSANAATILSVDYTASFGINTNPAKFGTFSSTEITIGSSPNPQFYFSDYVHPSGGITPKSSVRLSPGINAQVSSSASQAVVFGINSSIANGATSAETLGAPGYYGLEFELADGSEQEGYALVDRGGYHISEIGFRPLGTSDVPEPESWALMILGLGGAGAALRRRRQQTPAVA